MIRYDDLFSPLEFARSMNQGRVCLEGATVSLSDFRIVDSKFASYRIIVTPAAGVGARWEVCQEGC